MTLVNGLWCWSHGVGVVEQVEPNNNNNTQILP
jgi:hypothetical protein